jgi:hypothetical protein
MISQYNRLVNSYINLFCLKHDVIFLKHENNMYNEEQLISFADKQDVVYLIYLSDIRYDIDKNKNPKQILKSLLNGVKKFSSYCECNA